MSFTEWSNAKKKKKQEEESHSYSPPIEKLSVEENSNTGMTFAEWSNKKKGVQTTSEDEDEYEAALRSYLQQDNLQQRDAKRKEAQANYSQADLDLIDEYDRTMYDDTLFGQFMANYKQGRLSQDSSLAWAKYIKEPTAENYASAVAVDEALERFVNQNPHALDDIGQKAPWVTETLAGYLPQLADQLKYSAVAGATGAAAGAGVGTFALPGVGTLGGAMYGLQAGTVAGSGLYSYKTMQGAAYRELINAGVDEGTAIKAASDEAVISSLIEMADTGIDIATLGGGTLIKNILSEGLEKAVKSDAKKRLIKALGGYGLNIAGEMAEEGAQEAVSIANMNRDDIGERNLAGEAAQTIWGAVQGDTEADLENRQQIIEAAKEGGKIAAMVGGASAAVNTAANEVLTRRAEKKANSTHSTLVDEILTLDPENETAKQLQGEAAVTTEQLMQLMWERDRLQKPEMPVVAKQREMGAAETASPQSPLATASYAHPSGALAKGSQESAVTEVTEVTEETEEETVTLESASKKYGAQAGAMIHTYQAGQNVRQYDAAYQSAYDMGKSGVNLSYAKSSASTAYLTETQRELAYEAGKASENAVKAPETVDEYDVSSEGKHLYKVTDAAGNVTYEVAEPGKVVSVEGNSMTIEVGDGVEAASADISYATNGEAVLYHTVAIVANTADEANTLIGGYEASGLTHEQYAAGIRNAYDAGRFNEPKGAVMKQRAVKKLPADVAEAAYSAGQSFVTGRAEKAEAAVKAKIPEGAKADRQGTVQYMEGSKRSDFRARIKQKGKYLNAKQEAAIQTAEMLSQMTGVNFIVYESYRNAEGKLVYSDRNGKEAPAPNGFYYDGTGDIYIDLNAGNSGEGLMLYTMAHELTHFIKAWSPKKYRILANALMDEYSKTEGKTVERLVEEQILKAARNGRAISEDIAYEEAVANSMEQILKSGRVVEFMADIKRQDKSLWQKIKQWFKDFADKLKSIREAYAGAKPDSAEAKIVADIDGALERLEPIFAEALAEAGDNYQSAATKNTAEDGGVKYQIREQFYSELDAWNGKSDKTFQVGTTSEALKSIGVKDTGIIWHSRKIAKIMREHEAMTRDIIKQVPQILENPVAVLASKNSESRIVIFGTVNDENGVPVTAILELRPTNKGGQVMNLNVIASAYGKDNAKRFVESSGLIYLDKDKKRTESWMQGLGLQLPSDTTAFGSIGRISYPNNEVKIDSVPYSQYMQSSERKYSDRDSAAQKTAAEDGGVKYSFRGTNQDGIEVYETSEEVKKLPYKERQKRFLEIMTNEYRGRTAKFIRNGHTYYATFEEKDVNKNIYGDKLSDQKGWKAKINVGAEGNIFELVENAQYNGSKPEAGKKITAHRGVGYWDYFVKNVQIDNTVFDLTANVRKKTDGAFVYSIQLKQNKKIKASPPLGLLSKALDGVPNASNTKVAQSDPEVKRSDRDYMDAVNRGDMETAQRMVDEAAERAFPNSVLRGEDGKLIKVYHGSSTNFNVFRNREGYYFAPWKAYAAQYGSNVRAFYLNLTNPIEYDFDFNQLNDVSEDSADGFIWCGEDMEGGIDQNRVGDTEVVVYDSIQIKSADPVTYDDDGNVIPLSRRFDEQNPDIRYSERDPAATKNTAEDGGVRYSDRLSYNDAIDQLEAGTLDRATNTHLKLLDYTPQLYVDKAGAKNLKIIMGWDIAYLAMKKTGELSGNYHGLGTEVMKGIPAALQDPLYILKQNSGRILAVTEVVVKGNRSVLVSVELDAFKTTVQDGENESDNYNLIVTVFDAKTNYIQRMFDSGEVVYNKNNEDPANFILRLKSLKKALSNDDLATSSDSSISDDIKNSNIKYSERDPAATKNTAEDGSVKYSLRVFEDGVRFVDVQTDQHLFDGLTKEEANTLAKNVIRDRFAGRVIGIDNKVYVNMQTAKEYIHPVKNIDDDIRNAKVRASAELDNLIDAGRNFRTAPDGLDGHVHPDVATGFDYFDSIFKVGNEYYTGVINIKNIKNGKLLKDVTKIENITQDIISSYGVNPKSEFLRDASMDIISVEDENSNRKFSDRDPAAQKTAAALSRENKHLKEDVKNLRELVRLQNKVTGGTKVVRADVDKMAKLLMKNNDVKGDYRELTPLLMDVYEYIARNDEVTWEGVVERSQPAVDWLMKHVQQTDKLDPYAQEILDVLKSSSVRFNDAQKKEAAYHSDGWGKYRNSIIGAIGVSDKASMTLDQLWADLAESYPATFDASIPDTQQPAELAEIIDELRNMKELDDGYSDALFEQSLTNDVYDGYWRVSTLHTVADRYQAQIDQMKHQHFQEMKKSKNRLDSTVKRLREEKNDALKQLRKKKDEQIKETRERYKESRANAVNKRRLNAAKKKIQRVISQLDKLLTQGTKERNVKEELKGFVAKALHSAEAFFADEYSDIDMIRNGIGTQMTPAEAERAAEVKELVDEIDEINDEIDALKQLPSAPQIVEQIDALQAEVKDLEQKAKYRINTYLSDVMIRERARLSETKLSDVITELADAYKELENADGYLKGVYDEYVYAAIENKKNVFDGTVVKDMDYAQLEELHDLYSMVLHTVRNANKAFTSARNESIASLAEQVVGELGAQQRRKKLHPKGTKAAEKFSWNNEKPVYAFMRMGSDVLSEMYEEIRKGEDVWAKNMEEARGFFLAVAEKYDLKSWDMDAMYEFESASGDKFSLNIDQMMSIYAYAKREQAADHLRKGGIVISDDMEVVIKKKGIPVKYESEDATAYDISDVTLQEIVKTLKKAQPEAIGFADEMQAYLSDEMGAKGNEVSLKLYGVKLFKDQHYFPLKSAGQYLERAREQQERSGKIKNKGFTKDTKPHASNPIVLNGFLDTWAGHVDEMSMYHAFTLPMEDFYRVYNFSTKHVEGETANAVIPMLQNTHGKAATNYIDDLLKDLNGGARADPRENTAAQMVGNFKKAAVFASASVVIQQPSSIARAFALVHPKYFVGEKIDAKKHKETWAEVKKYAPVAVIKEMGYFDTNMGRSSKDFLLAQKYEGWGEKAKALITDGDYRDEWFSKAPALADELAWCGIWNAVKREQALANPTLATSSDEFLEICGKRFTEVIAKTQVYDSVLARSGNMRAKGVFMSMWTAFMGEPTVSINMMEHALRKLVKDGDRETFAKTTGAVVSSIVLNSLLVSLVYAMRDDDEESTFAEKYVSSALTEIADGLNPLTYYPGIKDVWSILQGYDVERADMSLVSDLASAMTKATQLLAKDTSDMSEEELAAHWKKVTNSMWSVVDYTTAMFGLPVKNVRRDFLAAKSFISTMGKDMTERDTSWGSLIDKTWDSVKNTIPVIGWMSDESKADKLYHATVKGDTTYVKRLNSTYSTESSLNSALRKGLRENDPRIREAAIAWNAGDNAKYQQIAKAIVAEKHFSQDNIVKAIRAEANALKPASSSS